MPGVRPADTDQDVVFRSEVEADVALAFAAVLRSHDHVDEGFSDRREQTETGGAAQERAGLRRRAGVDDEVRVGGELVDAGLGRVLLNLRVVGELGEPRVPFAVALRPFLQVRGEVDVRDPPTERLVERVKLAADTDRVDDDDRPVGQGRDDRPEAVGDPPAVGRGVELLPVLLERAAVLQVPPAVGGRPGPQ